MKPVLWTFVFIQHKLQALNMWTSYGYMFMCWQEKASQVESERAMMEEEKQRLAKEIEKWEKEFKKKNKREPTEDEKWVF